MSKLEKLQEELEEVKTQITQAVGDHDISKNQREHATELVNRWLELRQKIDDLEECEHVEMNDGLCLECGKVL